MVVGRIVRPHGVRGDVLVAPTGDDPDRFTRGRKLYPGPDEPASLTVRSRHEAQGFYRLHFDEVADRDHAEELVGRDLYLETALLPDLPVGTYYHYQLVGLTVRKQGGAVLGTVVRVHELPGSDLYEVVSEDGEREWMIPARDEVLAAVDLDRSEILLRECDDLLAAVENRKTSPREGGMTRKQAARARHGESGGGESAES
ncbi:MAG: 16S rRNA processing protein RimM [Candidatus Eisenbacteria bacterium]|uniref:Ribosome maturation factor RimM n=1 Tax=Eiseniibacteriota bacterium TaxID=2212470 RepID=A0A956LW50_UNCEI|nr:16S rRNA processing protein RimM [Candidatus Eisenbacteria bacterium]